MKQEFKTLLLLVMLTFLSVHCGADSSSGDDDDAELPPFTASESVDGSEEEVMSVFEKLLDAIDTDTQSNGAIITFEDACADGDCHMDEGEDDPTVDDCQSGKRACYSLEDWVGIKR